MQTKEGHDATYIYYLIFIFLIEGDEKIGGDLRKSVYNEERLA